MVLLSTLSVRARQLMVRWSSAMNSCCLDDVGRKYNIVQPRFASKIDLADVNLKEMVVEKMSGYLPILP